MTQLQHGGRILDACQRYGGQPEEWVDLSTGVNPWSYPLPELTMSDTTRLPEPAALRLLEEDAAVAYGVADSQNVIAVPGSQAAIA